ncbi:hypothetical protein AUEXF2481DRAFT_2740 [Aureobasidium subglaciale EXF-2481]|uniref:Uncharacterized protein n=1 Tax=Aureobasidium subglaciale (strain EXF-2481) TaxID=1043005 RepID=A0A074YUK8_AURSE|nr:uncharacterized protein AUEXF2481DRAFT_2740 [Aureobasidium subglaciale EXF-2481]KAI5197444.1 hypothetical protein E4T38_08001 [Aureobasidium subglaciale]KAI5216292.1 hypothetical protein E4T40_08011 [Aureobasidium subglaciale]KAI5219578.1 hypothetical protein E4T41_07926 [Aureobasidium subglaciale]KAI5257619.1 hypothetical protein E4T46_07902 [Aureobasidium subglaciale]KEQ97817.1 hypothetical protein AUEXF2481DRAFT_2740 [Aureobasidium subglaciale EXF-2481]
MAAHEIRPDVYGPGTFADVDFTPLPTEAARLLRHLAQITPGFTASAAALENVEFSGRDLPIIPGPLKSQAFTAALQAMIGIVGKELNELRGIAVGKIYIDVDKCGLYPATPALVSIGKMDIAEIQKTGTLAKVGTDVDHGVVNKTPLYVRSWAIYPTKDPVVWYQIMSSLDTPGFLESYGIDASMDVSSKDEAYEVLKKTFSKYSAAELDLKNMEDGFCGQTCYTPEQWRKTLMGKTLARQPLVNIRRINDGHGPVPLKGSEDKRPLAGVKIIELARVIAAPATCAALASLGAEIIKVQSPNIPDLQPLSLTLTAGKKIYALDLTKQADKDKLHNLIDGADVVVQAFRLGSMKRKGFGLEGILDIIKQRNKGIVYLDLNCYGPDGYYAERPGFQQIADAASGCSYVMGKAYGFDEGVGVLPPLPIADMLSGALAVIDVMLALRDRAKHGGSYHANVALTAVDAIQLSKVFGLYSPEIVRKIQDTYNFAPMTPDLHVEELLYVLGDAWSKHGILKPEYMASFTTQWGENHAILSPIVKYDDSAAEPKWSHGPVPYCSSGTEPAWSS